MQRILVVEDDHSLGETLKNTLMRLPAEVELAKNLREAVIFLRLGRKFDLLILDRNLPDGDGVSLLDVLQDEFYDLRVLIMTTLDQQFEIEEGLGAGASDYLTKPFSWNELMLRVKNLLRSRKVGGDEVYRLGNLVFYAQAHRLLGENGEIHLRAKEAALLRYFCQRPNQVISRDDLLKVFWTADELAEKKVDRHILSVYLQRLRIHLGEQAWLLQTIPKIGYQLKLAR